MLKGYCKQYFCLINNFQINVVVSNDNIVTLSFYRSKFLQQRYGQMLSKFYIYYHFQTIIVFSNKYFNKILLSPSQTDLPLLLNFLSHLFLSSSVQFEVLVQSDIRYRVQVYYPEDLSYGTHVIILLFSLDKIDYGDSSKLILMWFYSCFV